MPMAGDCNLDSIAHPLQGMSRLDHMGTDRLKIIAAALNGLKMTIITLWSLAIMNYSDVV